MARRSDVFEASTASADEDFDDFATGDFESGEGDEL